MAVVARRLDVQPLERAYDRPGSTLYINDGIGSVGYPMRIGARPEITLITLRRCS